NGPPVPPHRSAVVERCDAKLGRHEIRRPLRRHARDKIRDRLLRRALVLGGKRITDLHEGAACRASCKQRRQQCATAKTHGTNQTTCGAVWVGERTSGLDGLGGGGGG